MNIRTGILNPNANLLHKLVNLILTSGRSALERTSAFRERLTLSGGRLFVLLPLHALYVSPSEPPGKHLLRATFHTPLNVRATGNSCSPTFSGLSVQFFEHLHAHTHPRPRSPHALFYICVVAKRRTTLHDTNQQIHFALISRVRIWYARVLHINGQRPSSTTTNTLRIIESECVHSTVAHAHAHRQKTKKKSNRTEPEPLSCF